jgi:GNAT superfamily N-acetyltransferase
VTGICQREQAQATASERPPLPEPLSGSAAGVLDNAAWHSLRGAHAVFAEGNGVALRYPREVADFHASPDDTPMSWRAVADMATGDVTVFRAIGINPPSTWAEVASGVVLQMVLDESVSAPASPSPAPGNDGTAHLRRLGRGDVPAMMRLAEQTQPGPFHARTIELGGYVGVFHGRQLVAMAGQRLRPPGWCEVSAVCTRPDARRRGYGSLLTRYVAGRIAARGERPFLHVFAGNTAAVAAYEHLGFATRTTVPFSVLRPSSAGR